MISDGNDTIERDDLLGVEGQTSRTKKSRGNGLLMYCWACRM